MKTLTVRLPEPLAAEIAAESRQRRLSKSDVIRERLEARGKSTPRAPALDAIEDLIGSLDDLPPKLSAQKKAYLHRTGYGRKRHR
jgi:Arc/MetJ-type ribon-helix-helix transcriptional regulator